MIILARHGQTEVNRGGRLQGRSDAALTPLGRAQAARIADALELAVPELVVTSPLPRAVETARVVADGLGVSAPVVDDRLIELDYGEWEGRRVEEVTAQEWADWRADPTFAPPGGESLRAVHERMTEFCEEHLAGGRQVCCVSHVSPIKAAVAWALGVGDAATWRMYLAVASLSRIEGRGGRPTLTSFNETAHLDGLDGSGGVPPVFPRDGRE